MKFIDRTGEEHTTKEGYTVKIIKYTNQGDCDIQFIGTEIIIKNRQYGDVKRGEVLNPYRLSVCGVGYLGQGKFNASSKEYNRWANMLLRCYDEKAQEKHPTYKDVSVCEEWHCFQNFAKWYEENWESHMQGWHLDKDILVKGNRIYSPKTCCFVPQEINVIFTKQFKKRKLKEGVYKNYNRFFIKFRGNYIKTFSTSYEACLALSILKKDYIKEVADKWRGKITEQVYNALINYKVEIDD